MIKTVVREHHWEPSVIGGLFLDSEDWRGLQYWYDDVRKCIEEVERRTKKSAK